MQTEDELAGLRAAGTAWLSQRVGALAIDGALVLYAGCVLCYLLTGSVWRGVPGLTLPEGFQWLLVTAAALLLGGLWSCSSHSPGRSLMAGASRGPAARGAVRTAPGRGWLRTLSVALVLALVALTLVLGWRVIDVRPADLFSFEGLSGARRIFTALLRPELSILPQVLEKMVETIFIALAATLFAVPLAFLASFPSARNLMRGSKGLLGIYTALRIVANFTRSVEPLVWAIVFSVWVGIGPFAGMLALMLHSVASLTKLYSEQIEGVERGPIEAIEATGANRLQVLWYAVVPQVVLPYLSFTIYRWDINIRMATVIGLVGGGGVGTLLMQSQGLGRWNEVGTIVLVIALVVWAMDHLSARVREAIY